jgi:branched-chain amino acid transport system permease protein
MMRRSFAIFAVALVVLALLPFARELLGFPTFYLSFAYLVGFWAAQATSWNILSGFSGYFSFGQGAFFGVGAYTTAVLAGRHGWDLFVTLPMAALLALALALAIGALAFRLSSLRGEVFALLTLAVPFILASVARISPAIDGGQGVVMTVPPYADLFGGFQSMIYLLGAAIGLGAVAVAFVMQHSRLGWALFAVRDAEDVAEGLGVPTFRYKMVAISLTGVIGGVAGGVYALQIGFITVEAAFGLTVPLFVIVMSVLGGRAHWLGPAIGALIVVTLRQWLTTHAFEGWGLVILGLVLAVLVLVAPEGILARIRARTAASVGTFAVALAVLTLLGVLGIGVWDGAPLQPVDWITGAMAAAAVVAFWPMRRRGVAAAQALRAASGAALTDVEAPSTSELEVADASGEAPAAAAPAAPARPTGDAPPVLACRDVAKDFGGVHALRGVSLTIHEGELIGLVGPNGSGKTTLVNLISGAFRPTRGNVELEGTSIVGVAPHRIAHMGIARTYQIPRPFESMTVRDNVAVAIMFGRGGRSLGVARSAAQEHLDLVGLAHLADARPAEINLHERQLLEMARAIATRPRVLLLDEALAGLTPAEIDSAAAVVRRINAAGITIVLVEHLLRVVNQLATRMVVLDQGRTLAEGEPRAVMDDPAVVRAYLGRRAHA